MEYQQWANSNAGAGSNDADLDASQMSASQPLVPSARGSQCAGSPDLEQQRQQQQQQQQQQGSNRLSIASLNVAGGGMYNHQGSVVAMPVSDSIHTVEDSSTLAGGNISYVPVPQYSMTAGGYIPTEYMSMNAYPVTGQQLLSAQHQQQLLEHQHQQQQQQQLLLQHKQMVLAAAAASAAANAGPNSNFGAGQQYLPSSFTPQPIQSYDRCPAVCSLFAIFCCPITLWCSLPALVYSLCAYTDYRAADVEQYQRKSDTARRLVIIACVVGLLLCITWAVLAFFYYDLMLAVVSDFTRVLNHRVRTGT